ncbi:hypothetical protein [Metabacillus fastidiosus]|uniref:hypothetical protein n=1 Tax=Metabacillus fastidiosus TaxID=1458 RepID=UPI002E2444D6|nr:hypothetical protein [Metabacillus fastidiosus]
MERATIHVPVELKKQIQELKDKGGFKSEWEVIDFLLRVDRHLNAIEVQAFLDLRAKMFQSFEKLKLSDNSKED